MGASTPEFSDPQLVSNYAEKTARVVPGLLDLHKMAGVLLAERVPSEAKILVLGAGGGLEIKSLSALQPDWRFVGVDPSQEMLQLAQSTLNSLGDRVDFQLGYIDDAPPGPFDAAICLLTLHFLEKDERLRTLGEIAPRLKPGAPLVTAHHSFPHQGDDLDKWLGRHAAFGASNGVPASQAQTGLEAMKARLPVLSPHEDETLLTDAGFIGVELFFAALTFKGWICYKPTSS